MKEPDADETHDMTLDGKEVPEGTEIPPTPRIPEGAAHWSQVCAALRQTVGEDSFQRWFRNAEWAGAEDGLATITVPGEIHQVWIEANYLPELNAAVN